MNFYQKEIQLYYDVVGKDYGTDYVRVTLDEVNNADEVILMDSYNEMRFKNEFPHAKNAKKLLFYSNSNADVSDPWYSERYDECFEIIYYGIKNYIKYLLNTK